MKKEEQDRIIHEWAGLLSTKEPWSSEHPSTKLPLVHESMRFLRKMTKEELLEFFFGPIT